LVISSNISHTQKKVILYDWFHRPNFEAETILVVIQIYEMRQTFIPSTLLSAGLKVYLIGFLVTLYLYIKIKGGKILKS
jgi:hypothetical protein